MKEFIGITYSLLGGAASLALWTGLFVAYATRKMGRDEPVRQDYYFVFIFVAPIAFFIGTVVCATLFIWGIE